MDSTFVLKNPQETKQTTRKSGNKLLLIASFLGSVAFGYAANVYFNNHTGPSIVSKPVADDAILAEIQNQISKPVLVKVPKIEPNRGRRRNKGIDITEDHKANGDPKEMLKEEQATLEVPGANDALTPRQRKQLENVKKNDIEKVKSRKNGKKTKRQEAAAPSTYYVYASNYDQSQGLVSPYLICDGVDDDVEINAAIELLQSSSATRRKLVLSAGRFNMNGPVFITERLDIEGAGMSQTILRMIDNAVPFEKAGFFRAFFVNDFSITKLTADGNKDGQIHDAAHSYGRFGTYYEACNRTRTAEVRFTNWYGYGFDPHGTGGTTIFGDNMIVENCVSDNNGWDGYTIDKNKDSFVRYNVAYDNGRHGINIVTGTYDTDVHNNNVYNNGFYYYTGARGNGITVQNNQDYNTHDIRVYSNTVTGNRGRGILLNGVGSCEVRDNTIDSISSCILVLDSPNTKLARNVCGSGKFIVIEGNNPGLLIDNQDFIQCAF